MGQQLGFPNLTAATLQPKPQTAPITAASVLMPVTSMPQYTLMQQPVLINNVVQMQSVLVPVQPVTIISGSS